MYFILRTVVSVDLKNKAVILPAKMVYLGRAKNCNSGQASHSKSHRQVQQAEERSIILWRKRRKLRRIVLNENPLEKSKNSGRRPFLIG